MVVKYVMVEVQTGRPQSSTQLLQINQSIAMPRSSFRPTKIAYQVGGVRLADFSHEFGDSRGGGLSIVRRHRVPVPENDAGMRTIFGRPLAQQIGNGLLVVGQPDAPFFVARCQDVGVVGMQECAATPVGQMDRIEAGYTPPQGFHHRFLHVAIEKEFQRRAFRFAWGFASRTG